MLSAAVYVSGPSLQLFYNLVDDMSYYYPVV